MSKCSSLASLGLLPENFEMPLHFYGFEEHVALGYEGGVAQCTPDGWEFVKSLRLMRDQGRDRAGYLIAQVTCRLTCSGCFEVCEVWIRGDIIVQLHPAQLAFFRVWRTSRISELSYRRQD